MTATQEAPAVHDQAEAFAELLVSSALGALELTTYHMGRELGLYEALRGEDGSTVADVAKRAGADERYTREWIEHQAVAGAVTVENPGEAAEDRRYALPEAHAGVLLDEEDPNYAGALADISPILARCLDRLVLTFRTGEGIPFADYELHDMQAGFTRPMFANSLTGEWIAAMPDTHARLEAGESLRIADFGCGEGWAAIYVAEAYPNVTVDGFDLDEVSIAAARKNAADRGLAGRVRFELRDITDASVAEGEDGRRYDLAMACEVIHDLPDPAGALSVMRKVTEDGGAVLIIDENAAEEFSASGDPIERLLYAISIMHCLPAGRDAESSVATGTVMRPEVFRRYAAAAGFTSVDELAIEHPFFRFYTPAG